MTILRLNELESRDAAVAFDLAFAPDPWLTPDRRAVIAAAFGQWGRLWADDLPPVAAPDVGQDTRGRAVPHDPTPTPADTVRVWVGVAPLPDRYAEAGYGYSAGQPLPRPPVWGVTFDPSRVSDGLLPMVALHEAGHVVGLDHQPDATPPEWRTVMYPAADPARATLTGLEARDLVWAGHEVAVGAVMTGIGTTPGGWMVYFGR